ncbi:MAG: SixA phosphatase family protein [Solirubrobacteraceae bacterium]
MARHLWLLRHGDAVPHGSRPDDDDRELTPKGEGQASLAGRALARVGVELAACYTSPKLRARDTARLACAELGVAPEEAPALAGDFARADAEELLLAHDADAHVLLVGHEPDLSQVVLDLTGARVHFRKGGLAAVQVSSASELVVLLRPAELEPMAGS